LDELPGKSNYLLGNDPSRWRTNVPTYRKVKYQDAYPGIDLVFYGNQRQLEYDFVVAPGADPAAIRLAFHGARRLTVDRRGDLVLSIGKSELRFLKPVVYQESTARGKVSAVSSSSAPHGKSDSSLLHTIAPDPLSSIPC